MRAGNIWRGGLTYINFRSHRPFQGHSRDRRPIHVGFMVDKVALGQVFDRVLQCCPLRIVQLDTCITRKCEKTLGGGGWGGGSRDECFRTSSPLLSKDIRVKIYSNVTFLFCTSVNFGLAHCGKNTGQWCSKIGCFGRYLSLNGSNRRLD